MKTEPREGWAGRGLDSGNTPGFKADKGKPRMSLLPPAVLEEVAGVFTYGANKYGDYNWLEGMNWSRQSDAALRHISAYLRREDIDPESGYHHLSHAICSLMMLLDYQLQGKVYGGLDDRFTLCPIPFVANGGAAEQEQPQSPLAPEYQVGDWVKTHEVEGFVVGMSSEGNPTLLVEVNKLHRTGVKFWTSEAWLKDDYPAVCIGLPHYWVRESEVIEGPRRPTGDLA